MSSKYLKYRHGNLLHFNIQIGRYSYAFEFVNKVRDVI